MEAFRSAPVFSRVLHQGRILTLALATGMFSFAAVVGYLAMIRVAPILSGDNAAQARLLFAAGAAGFTVLQIAVSFMIGSILDASLIKRLREMLSSDPVRGTTDPARILADERLDHALAQWLSNRIVRMALIEGAGFFALVATLLTASPIAAGAAAVAWVAVILHFPGETGLLHWLETIARRVREPF
jgi:hypothetical protein